MDIIDLVLTICLVSNPSNCREERLHFENRGSLNACVFTAQTEIAKWTQEHPGHRVVRWKCAYPSEERVL
jgi:hypothetical protein